MARFTQDPLLGIARIVLWVLLVVIAVAAVGCVLGLIAVPIIWFNQAAIAAHIDGDLPPGAIAQLAPAVALLLTGALAMLACLWRVIVQLMRIVDTVGEGDPFVPVNARRLTQMAWLSLAIQIVSIPMAAAGVWIARVVDKAGAHADVDVDVGINANSLLLVLILFILARVFRKGAAMRADLEGMV